MNPFRRGYNRIVWLTGIALILITLGIEYFQYQRNQHLVLIDLKNRLDEHTSNVNLRARTIQGYVTGLKTAAENNLFYIKKFGITSPLFSYLRNNLEKKSYYLDLEDLKIDRALVGNLMGLGSIEEFSENLRAEINMALLLNTHFETALRHNRGSVWVYYTSKNHFQNLYPWIPLRPDSYHRAVENKFFFQGATPKLNPDRLNFWTPAYQDGASYESGYQKGIIVTNSSPIYDGDEFLGSVSLDLSLTELNRIMNRFDSLQGSLLLINKYHQVLATNGGETATLPPHQIAKLEQFVTSDLIDKIDQEIKVPSEWFSFNKSSILYVRNLHEAPWFIVYTSSKSELFLKSIFEALEDILIITATLIFVVGLGYLMVIRDFISPAQKLVNHIEKENRGEKSVPKTSLTDGDLGLISFPGFLRKIELLWKI